MKAPLVSISITAYRARYLNTTIRSALAQSYKNIEVIVQDQCLTEDAAEICRRYPSVRYHRSAEIKEVEDLSDILLNLTHSIELSKGMFVNLLSEDDVLHPFAIEKMVTPMVKDESVHLSFVLPQTIDKKNHFGSILTILKGNKKTHIQGKQIIKQLLRSLNNFIGEPSNALFRKSVIKIRESKYIDFFDDEDLV